MDFAKTLREKMACHAPVISAEGRRDQIDGHAEDLLQFLAAFAQIVGEVLRAGLPPVDVARAMHAHAHARRRHVPEMPGGQATGLAQKPGWNEEGAPDAVFLKPWQQQFVIRAEGIVAGHMHFGSGGAGIFQNLLQKRSHPRERQPGIKFVGRSLRHLGQIMHANDHLEAVAAHAFFLSGAAAKSAASAARMGAGRSRSS